MKFKEMWKLADEEAYTLLALRDRWQDERLYEDINDYLRVVQSKIPCAYEMMKRPFGFKAKCEDGTFKVYLKMNGNKFSLVGQKI